MNDDPSKPLKRLWRDLKQHVEQQDNPAPFTTSQTLKRCG
jgi:hypothetical protein